MIGNMTQWVFHVIMSSWCHVIWNHSTLEFHLHMWIFSPIENISYSSDLISLHGFDIYHLIYMLCIFAVDFYLLCAHWEHFAHVDYTLCALGALIHSIMLCALGTLNMCWVHFMCRGYIDIWQYFMRAWFIDAWHRWFVVFELYIVSALLIHLSWLWHLVDSRDIYLYLP